MDDVDLAQARMEREEELRPKPVTRLVERTGCCHYCGERVGPDVVYCSQECRDDDERLQRSKSCYK